MNSQSSITLVLGGAGSGKTAWAEAAAVGIAAQSPSSKQGSKPVYLATGQATDEEMKARIERHRKLRADRFSTIESPLEIASIIAERGAGEVLLIDSIGTWIANLMHAEADIDAAFDGLLEAAEGCSGSCVFVSDETGMGIVPENAMARSFRDRIGLLNQRLAEAAGQVVLVVAGIPLTIKG